MKRTVTASFVILIVFLFPFRFSFMSPDVTGITSIINFILVIMGILVFLFLTLRKDKHTSA